MKEIISYVTQYIRKADKWVLLFTTFFIGSLIWYNYDTGLHKRINSGPNELQHFLIWYVIFLGTMLVPYSLYAIKLKRKYFNSPYFLFLFFLAPAIFSLKMVMSTTILLVENTRWNEYWNHILYWPLRLIFIVTILLVIWWVFYRKEPFFGCITYKTTNNKAWWRPYILLLLMMIPLIALAATQPDFLDTYPKLKQVENLIHNEKNAWLYRFLFELSYGTDFISIELFFRGFMVLAFIKLAGKDAILPMACYYCAIHFGKPLGECISSYFGGLLLGVIVYNTRSVYGGLIAHLGIAWLMELGGYVGNYFKA